jgi:hypothetical protein
MSYSMYINTIKSNAHITTPQIFFYNRSALLYIEIVITKGNYEMNINKETATAESMELKKENIVQ